MELDALLKKHGAAQRAFMDDDAKGEAVVMFTLRERQFRLAIPLPKLDAFKRVCSRRSWKDATPEQQRKAHEQACRERWRAVVLLVKAKLELIALGVSSAEREFLADLVLPDGMRVHDRLKLAISDTYQSGKPLALPAHEDT